MTKISKIVADRGIKEVLHFTTNRGLVGVLASAQLLSRRRLGEDAYLKEILHNNSINRPEEAESFDKEEDWLDFVNLSISAINSSYMGFSRRWTHNQSIWWCILSFDPEILDHPGVYFATTNNGYDHCKRNPKSAGLEALFASSIRRKGTWSVVRRNRSDNLPTCQQAEALYPGSVSTEYLRKIYVQTEEDADCAKGWLRDFNLDAIDVELADDVFQGQPN